MCFCSPSQDEVKSRIRARGWERTIHPADADRIVSLHIGREGGPRLDLLDPAGMVLTENQCVVYAKLKKDMLRPEGALRCCLLCACGNNLSLYPGFAGFVSCLIPQFYWTYGVKNTASQIGRERVQ